MIMKSIFNSLMALAALSTAFVACQKEDALTPAKEESKPFYVTVNNPFSATEPQSKATFEDGKGMSWEDTDYSKFLMIAGTEKGSGSVSAAKSMTIDEVTSVATFEFETAPADGTTVSFFYGPDTKLEYSFNSVQTQTTLGKLNAENLCLKAVNVNVSETSASPKMQLVGTLQRFIIYSSTGKYSDEKVESIKMTSTDNVVGLIGYNYLGEPRVMPGADYSAAETETLIWSQSTAVTVTVTDHATINATDRTEALYRGIYMAVPAGSLSGYKYVITTDAAEYMMVSENPKVFDNGMVANVFVNLENASVTRQEKGTSVSEVKYVGGLPDEFTLDSAGKSAQGISYWYATVDGSTRENRVESTYDGTPFYSTDNVTFACTDETGAPVDWISCKYRQNDTWWDVTYEANDTDAERTAIITATYNIPGYIATPAMKSVKVIQPAL